MTDAAWKLLRSTLLDRYDDLIKGLVRALGTRDKAENALHDTYLRLLRENANDLGEIRNPHNYVFRMAMNAAATAKRNEPRWLTYDESEAFLDALDDRPNPEQVSAGASDLLFVRKVLDELPQRRRAIFEAAWIDELPQKDIAARHALSVRMVQIELKQAMEHILERLEKSNVLDFVSSSRKASTTREGSNSDG